MTPALSAALDILDALTDEEIAPMRAAINRAMRIAATRTGGTHGATAPWPPVDREIAWVLWTTSSEVLHRQF